ncbi:hypothetical protein TNCV_1347841 [Trichonephila clavipes]|nr:hypothetical protein TNCV_1347841 [Trichonephila clavipes]
MQEGTADRRGQSHPSHCTTSREDRQFVRMTRTEHSVTSRTIAQHINPPNGQHGFFRPTREASKTDHTEFFSHSLSSLLNYLRAFGDEPVAQVQDGQGIETCYFFKYTSPLHFFQTCYFLLRHRYPDGRGYELVSSVRALVPQKFSVEEELMHVKHVEVKSPHVGVMWKFEEELSAQVSFSSLNRGSNVRSHSSVATVLT